MWIKAMVVGCENREIETKRGKQCLTELFILDADNKKNIYVGQIWGKKFYNYKENEIVTFPISGITEKNKKTYLSLAVEEKR